MIGPTKNLQSEIARLTAKIKERERAASKARKDATDLVAVGLPGAEEAERQAVMVDGANTNERARRRLLRRQEREAKKRRGHGI